MTPVFVSDTFTHTLNAHAVTHMHAGVYARIYMDDRQMYAHVVAHLREGRGGRRDSSCPCINSYFLSNVSTFVFLRMCAYVYTERLLLQPSYPIGSPVGGGLRYAGQWTAASGEAGRGDPSLQIRDPGVSKARKSSFYLFCDVCLDGFNI